MMSLVQSSILNQSLMYSFVFRSIFIISQKTVQFMEELRNIIPNSEVRMRKGLHLKKVISQAKEKGFTAVVVVNESRKMPSILLILSCRFLRSV